MSRKSGIRINRLAVYMIKPKYQRFDDIVETNARPIAVSGVGQFVFEASRPKRPSWIQKFFGNELGEGLAILNSSTKAVFLVPVIDKKRTVNFAIAFGQGRHLLKEGVVEERFGLRVVLNSIGRNSFRSIDKTTLGAIPKHSKEQMGRDVPPADFGIDIEQDLVSSVTARSTDAMLGKVVTGKDALHSTAPVDLSNILAFLSHCLTTSRSKVYKENFDWIDQIAEVRNGKIEARLNLELIRRLQNRTIEKVWMAVPETVNWEEISGFRYLKPKRSELKDDLTLGEYFVALGTDDITLDTLRSNHVYPIGAATDEPLTRWSAFRCLYAEIEFRQKLYVLNNCKWYEIARDFSTAVEDYYQQIPEADIDLPDYENGTELEYNETAASRIGDACCMDQQLIPHGGGHNSIEFCDIYTSDNRLVHVKKYGGSSVLSHLFMQGAVSGELLVSDGEFRAKLNEKLPRGYKLANPKSTRPDPSRYEIVFAIISESSNPLNIPFFSKVSLRNARRRLESYGYKVTKKKIQKIPADSD